MPNPRTPSPDDGGLRAVLERELEQRRGRAPEPGEIFVLPETAELPVEWALLEARPKAFLAIPADTQPLAGSRDFALGPHVLSGPLTLRCGHPVEIAAARLRPELRTGLLDPHSLAAVRSLQTALARGTASDDPMGEEVDRDPEYRDWVEEVLDPARAVMVGLGGDVPADSTGAKVMPFEASRGRRGEPGGRGATFSRVLPWLVAASLAIGLGLQRKEFYKFRRDLLVTRFDQPSEYLPPGIVRGETKIDLPRASGDPGEIFNLSGRVPGDLEEQPMALVLLGQANREMARSVLRTRHPSEDWSINLLRADLVPGPYRIQLQNAAREPLFSWDIRFVEAP